MGATVVVVGEKGGYALWLLFVLRDPTPKKGKE